MLTVCIPMYRTKHVGWISLESFCNQNKPPCDWELLVCQENHDMMMPWDMIMDYQERLEEAGCKRLGCIPLDEWMPLPRKWQHMAHHAHGSHILLCGAEDYCQPNRLIESHQGVEANADWQCKRWAIQRHLQTGKQIIKRCRSRAAGVEMMVRTSLLRNAKLDDRKWGVDNLLRRACKPKNVRTIHKSSTWLEGFLTYGQNNISKPPCDWSTAPDTIHWKNIPAPVQHGLMSYYDLPELDTFPRPKGRAGW